MTTKERNYWYWNILSVQCGLDLSKSYFELDSNDLYYVSQIAEAMSVRKDKAKSRGRTLWDRAKDGSPF